VEAFLHRKCSSVTLKVDLTAIQELASYAEGEEKLVYESENVLRIAGPLCDRLMLFHARKSIPLNSDRSSLSLGI
jgi:hypothetical protein